MSHVRRHYRPIKCCKDPTTNDNKRVSQSQRRIPPIKFCRPRKIGRQKKVGRFLSHDKNRPIFDVTRTIFVGRCRRPTKSADFYRSSDRCFKIFCTSDPSSINVPLALVSAIARQLTLKERRSSPDVHVCLDNNDRFPICKSTVIGNKWNPTKSFRTRKH